MPMTAQPQRDSVGSDVEDAFGGAGADTLTGNASDNLLNGGFGADKLFGGAGEDIADYLDRDDAVNVSLDGQPNDGGPPGRPGQRPRQREPRRGHRGRPWGRGIDPDWRR